MAEKDKISDFIQQLYGENKKMKLSKQDIVSQMSSAVFPADVEVFFKELPEQAYDENNLVNNLNSIIERRKRVESVGGKIEL